VQVPQKPPPNSPWDKFRNYTADIHLRAAKTSKQLNERKEKLRTLAVESAAAGALGVPFGLVMGWHAYAGYVLTAVVANTLKEEYREYRKNKKALTAKEEEARELFEELFMVMDPDEEELHHSTDGGYDTYPAGHHPDNRAALVTIGEAVELPVEDEQESESEQEVPALPVLPSGDILLIGGPHTTPLSILPFELDARTPSLHRRNRPSLDLPFFKVLDPASLRKGPVGRVLEDAKGKDKDAFVTTDRWTFRNTRSGKPLPIRTRKPNRNEKELIPREYHNRKIVQADDYLLITQLPSFIDSDLKFLQAREPGDWHQLTLIAGLHGIGTRGLELLLTADGLAVLEKIANVAGEGRAQAFQALIKVSDVELTSDGFHKATSITIGPNDVVVLNEFEKAHYLSAREFAMKQLPHLPAHASTPRARPSKINQEDGEAPWHWDTRTRKA